MSLKKRIDKLAEAVQVLAQRDTAQQTQTDMSVSEEEFYGIVDILLGVGGVSTLLNNVENQHRPDAEVAADLEAAGFVRVNGEWSCPDAQFESDFIRGWLAEADEAGRTVRERARIERWAEQQ